MSDTVLDSHPGAGGFRQRALPYNPSSTTRQLSLASKGVRLIVQGLAIVALVAIGHGSASADASGAINAVGMQNQYADVLSQIGGKYVDVTAIEKNPNTDPHTFEANPEVAGAIASAELVVVNGVGYDSWADKIISAAPNAKRKVINVQHLLGLPDSTPNPHLWYDPKTMPAVAKAIAGALSEFQPSQTKYFQANLEKFDASLKPWTDAIAAFKAEYPNVPVAVTEPVSNYLLQALGTDIKTPFSLEVAIMNGTDPSPQDVTTQNSLFNEQKVKVFVYNQQVTDALTESFLALAKKNGIPVVGAYETMPTPGFTYQSWMMAEVNALKKAVADNVSTEVLTEGN